MNEAQASVLHNQVIIDNMMKLCEMTMRSDMIYMKAATVDEEVVTLLNVICARIQRDKTILDMLFAYSDNEPPGPSKLLVFAMLTSYIYRDDMVGNQSKDALLLLLSLTLTNNKIASYIHDDSNFSIYLVSGLTGLYSNLPMRIHDDFFNNFDTNWKRLEIKDLIHSKSYNTLHSFIKSLEFCNSLVSLSADVVKNQFLEYFYNGFLINVLAPTMIQNSPEEIVGTTSYLDLMIRVVTSQELLWSILRMLLCHKIQDTNQKEFHYYDGIVLIEIFIGRLASNNQQISIVTLNLFNTLLDFACEDLMVQLVFQYLVPKTHVVRKYLGPGDEAWALYKSSSWFLGQMPKCVRPDKTKLSPDIFKPLVDQNMSPEADNEFVLPISEAGSADSGVCISEYDVNQDLSVTVSMRMGKPEEVTNSLERRMQEILPENNSSIGRLSTFMRYQQEAKMNIITHQKKTSCWMWSYDWVEPSNDLIVTLHQQTPAHLKLKTKRVWMDDESPELIRKTPTLKMPSRDDDDDLLLTTEFDKSLDLPTPTSPVVPVKKSLKEEKKDEMDLTGLYDDNTKDEDFFDSIGQSENN